MKVTFLLCTLGYAYMYTRKTRFLFIVWIIFSHNILMWFVLLFNEINGSVFIFNDRLSDR